MGRLAGQDVTAASSTLMRAGGLLPVVVKEPSVSDPPRPRYLLRALPAYVFTALLMVGAFRLAQIGLERYRANGLALDATAASPDYDTDSVVAIFVACYAVAIFVWTVLLALVLAACFLINEHPPGLLRTLGATLASAVLLALVAPCATGVLIVLGGQSEPFGLWLAAGVASAFALFLSGLCAFVVHAAD
jgi:branched-subunit amino acid transport protein AzlD